MSYLLLDRPKQVLYAEKDAQTLTSATWQKLTWGSFLTAPATYGTVTDIGSDLSSLSQSGSVVAAVNCTSTGGTFTASGITFQNTAAPSGWTGYSGSLRISHSDSGFNSILNSIWYITSNPGTAGYVTLSGLTAGKNYSVQLFFADNRNTAAGDGGNYGNATNKAAMLPGISRSSGTIRSGGSSGYINGQYVMIYFTAASTSQTLSITCQTDVSDAGVILNAYIVRELSTSSVPYFTESSDTFTCTVPGRYYVQVQLANQTTSRGVYNRIHKNGSAVRMNSMGAWKASGGGFIQNDVLPVDLAAGDTLEVYSYSINGNSDLHKTSSSPQVGLRIFFAGGVGPNPIRPTHQKLLTVKTSGQSISNDVYSKCTMDAASVNTANFTDSSDTFTATIPGVYAIFWQVYTTGGEKSVLVYTNGAVYANSAPSNYHNQCFCLVELAVGDTLEFYLYPSSTTGLDVSKSVAEVVLL